MIVRSAPRIDPPVRVVDAPQLGPRPVVLQAENIAANYGKRRVLADLDLSVRRGEFVALVGPNGSGKSTLLKCLARILKPQSGRVMLSGRDLATLPNREIAQSLGFMPQSPSGPAHLRVRDLVAFGRHPHGHTWQRATAADARAIDFALAATHLADLADLPLAELSGGQRQRAWIALTLAQETDLLLLDEPTTFLDLAHALDVLEVLAEAHERSGRTIVMVMHDLNLAANYADRIVAMSAGKIMADGTPAEVLTADNLGRIFGLAAQIIADPQSGRPLIVPDRRIA
ncbi:MAG: ABC transporter ATP-binding protein [Angustibacter sp.]